VNVWREWVLMGHDVTHTDVIHCLF